MAMWFELLTMMIAGLRHRCEVGDVEALQSGDVLELRREPENRADQNAVAVYTGAGKQLGYVPAVSAPMVARMLDNDYPLRGVVDVATVHVSDKGHAKMDVAFTIEARRWGTSE